MTTRKVILRPTAETDLPALYHSMTERRGYSARAMAYMRRMRASCETLAAFPERGRRRDDLPPWSVDYRV